MDATIAAALGVFAESRCPALGVTDWDGVYVGLVTADELLRALALGDQQLALREIVTDSHPTLGPDASAASALRLLAGRSRVAAVIDGGTLVGVVTAESFLTDLVDQVVDEDFRALGGVERFLSFVAHDLRSPLCLIASSAEIVRANRTLDPTSAKFNAIIHRTAQRTLRTVDSLLRIERSRSGRGVELVPTKVEDFMEQLVADSAPAAELRHVHLVVERCESGVVTFDPLLIGRAMQNLVDNALKHSAPGSCIYLHALRSEGDDGAWLELGVRDEGAGLGSTDLETLFNPFVTNDAAGSFGLGMAIVKRCADLHDGHVRVGSKMQRGATFRLMLPWRAVAPLSSLPEVDGMRVPHGTTGLS